MLSFPGYQVEEKLLEDERTLLWRARRVADSLPVLIKCLPDPDPGWEEVAHLRREYTIMAELELPGAPPACELGKSSGAYYMVMEDPGGSSLDLWIRNAVPLEDPCMMRFSPRLFLQIASSMASELELIHRQNIIHLNFNPSSMLVDIKKGRVSIVDFRNAESIDRERFARGAPAGLAGGLAYISPEQTGRMNRDIDQRSDLYTLGVSLYRLACGHFPFETDDPAELIHCHMAKHPLSPVERNPDIPGIIADIIMKLMAKDVNERYQTAHGVLADLLQCRELCQENAGLPPFSLGSRDLPGIFLLKQGLYGREHQMRVLEEGFSRARGGVCQFMLISGPAGIGKTALVGEFCRYAAEQGCFLMTGAFDEDDNRPLRAFTQGFRVLTRQMQTRSETSMHYWKHAIMEAIGGDGDIAVALVPELGAMLNIEASPWELESPANQLRMHELVQRCLAAVSRPEHPLVVFLDNLQWADPLSWHLLKSLVKGPHSTVNRCQMLIAALDSDAQNELEPLVKGLQSLESGAAEWCDILLQELNEEECRQWTGQILTGRTLAEQREQVNGLADEIMLKTGGNPAHMHRMVEALLDGNILGFDLVSGLWQWDMDAVRQFPAADSVVNTMVKRMLRLEGRKRHVLEMAACIGPLFDPESLAFLAYISRDEVVRLLDEAVGEGVLTVESEANQAPEGNAGSVIPGMKRAESRLYRFVHRQLRETLCGSMTASRRQEIHYRLGRRLAALGPADVRHVLEEIFRHLYLGSGLMTDSAEREELAKMGLQAAREADDRGDRASSLEYYKSAADLAGAECWQKCPEQILALHEEGARAAFKCGAFRIGEELLDAALTHVADLLRSIPLLELKIDLLLAENRLYEALQTALEALRQLGLELPSQPAWQQVRELLDHVLIILKGCQSEDLALAPNMGDPEKLAVMGVLDKLAMPARLINMELFAIANLKLVELSLTFGNTQVSCKAYAYFGMILCTLADDIEEGCRVGEMAMRLAAAGGDAAIEAAVHQLVLRYIRPWKEPLRQVASGFLAAYHEALASGAVMEAASAMANYGIHLASSGGELGHVADTMASGAVIIRHLNQELILHFNEIFRQMVLNLRGEAPEPGLLKGSAYDESEMLPRHAANHNHSAITHVYFCKMYLNYLFGRNEEAWEYARLTGELLENIMGSILVPAFNFYNSLIQLDRYSRTHPAARGEILSRVADSQRQMRAWAEQCPVNYLQKYWLVEAEYFRALGRNADAMDAYDLAIRLARQHGYFQEEALALELAARFYIGKGNARIAALYMRDARLAYLHWGARAKVEELDHLYSHLLDQNRTVPERASSGSAATAAAAGFGFQVENLDMASALKASQAISQEIVLERLLDRMMSVLLENAGADRGFLVLKQKERLVVEAEMKSGDQAVRLLQSVPLEQVRERFASAVVNLVARTGESLMLNGEDSLAEFSGDRYLRTHRPKSVLCLPVMSRGQVIGALYLENRLTSQAFAPERVEMLGMLASQAAIALENAWLYGNLEQRVQERTRALAAANLNLQKEINQRHKAEEHIRHLAYHDTLTGLPNRKLFQERLGQEIARAGRQHSSVAVLFLDLNRFKDINDTYGHDIGDMVLCEVGQRLKSAVREFDMVSRLGGDEFTLFVTGIYSESDLNRVLVRIQEAFETPLTLKEISLQVACSLGVSMYPQDGLQPGELIGKADQAMYAAKKKLQQGGCSSVGTIS